MSKVTTTELVGIIYNFVEIFCGVSLYPYETQFSRRMIRSMLEDDGADISALFSRQMGKTETVADTVSGSSVIIPKLANMPMFKGDSRLEKYKDGLWVGIFAPTLRQTQITYNRMKARLENKQHARKILEDPEFNLGFTTSNGQTVALTNGSYASAISASEGSSIEGETFKFIILEEAQDISDFKTLKSIHPMGAAYNATTVNIGTATTFKANFYKVIQRNKKMYNEGDLRIRNHFEYNYLVGCKYNPKYAKYIEKEKISLGEDSDEFKMAYKLEWMLSSGMFIDDIEKFEMKNGDPLFERSGQDTSTNHVAGIDLGGKGDSTVVTVGEVDWDHPVVVEFQVNEEGNTDTFIAYNTYIVDWLEIFGDGYEEQYHIITEYLSNFKLSRIMVDATRESSMAERMKANMPYEVVPYVFTQRSKSDMYKFLNREIKAGRARFPSGGDARESREYKKFLEQLSALQKSYSGSNMIVRHPDERGAHDDYPDSWALMVYASKDKANFSSVQVADKRLIIPTSKSFVNKINKITARRR